jgi:hypothetical protein
LIFLDSAQIDGTRFAMNRSQNTQKKSSNPHFFCRFTVFARDRLAHPILFVHNLVSSPTALNKTGNERRKTHHKTCVYLVKRSWHCLEKRGYSSAGRALAWHARGQRFDPAYLHQSTAKNAVPVMQYSKSKSPSSRGLGHHPFTVSTGVRIP